MNDMVLCLHLHLLVGMEDTYILFVQFLTFEQESIKAKLDNHKCQTRLEKRLIAIRYSQ